MTFTALLLAGYTFIALLFIDSSLREGDGSGGGWDFPRVLGLLLCLVWPLTLAGTAIVAYQDRQIG
jgi:hypothetical protein